MSDALVTFARFPVVQGALAGALAAFSVDINAFRAWKSFDDAKTYDFKKALFRVVQGAVFGALLALGIGVA